MAVYLQTIKYRFFLNKWLKHIRFNSYKTLLKVLAKKKKESTTLQQINLRKKLKGDSLHSSILNASITRKLF